LMRDLCSGPRNSHVRVVQATLWYDRRYHICHDGDWGKNGGRVIEDPSCRIITRNLCTFRAHCHVHRSSAPSLLCALVLCSVVTRCII
jgi:hypothetical protein